MTTRAEILKRAEQPGGLSIADYPPDERVRAGGLIAHACKAGKLHRAKLSHKVVRYFADPLAAAEYVRANKPAVRPAPVTLKSARFAPDATVDYSRAKITIAPPPPDRPLRTNTHSTS
jgi:hypothetical protein